MSGASEPPLAAKMTSAVMAPPSAGAALPAPALPDRSSVMSGLLALFAPLLLASAPEAGPPSCPAGQVRFWYGWESACILPGRLEAVPACRSNEDSEESGDPGDLCPYTRSQLRAEATRARRQLESVGEAAPGSFLCRLEGTCPTQPTTAEAPAPPPPPALPRPPGRPRRRQLCAARNPRCGPGGMDHVLRRSRTRDRKRSHAAPDA